MENEDRPARRERSLKLDRQNDDHACENELSEKTLTLQE